jgi:MFS family permease
VTAGNLQSGPAMGEIIEIPDPIGTSSESDLMKGNKNEEKSPQSIFEIFNYLSWSFMTVMLFGNFVIGFNNFLEVILLSVFTNFRNEEPGLATKHMAMFSFPKSLLMFYGMVTDNVVVFGTYRKSWLVITTLVNILMIIICAAVNEELSTSLLLWLMIIQSAMIGFLDAIIDGLTIQGARTEGIIDGAEKFQTFIISMQGVGAIAGGIAVAAVLKESDTEPMQYLYIYVFFCGMLLVAALSLQADAEPKILEDEYQM